MAKKNARKGQKKTRVKMQESSAPATVQAAEASSSARKGGVSKGLMVVLGFLAVLTAVIVETVTIARKKVAQNIEFAHLGALTPKGTSDGECWGAQGMAVDSSGAWYHLDGQDPDWRLQKFSADMSFVGKYEPEEGEQMLQSPAALACPPSGGGVYVLERGGRIVVLDQDLKFQRAMASGCQSASSIDTDKDGNLYILDSGEQQVIVLDSQGKSLFSFGKPGSDKHSLASPVRLCVDAKGRIFVGENFNGQLRVSVFNPGGKYSHNFIASFPRGVYTNMAVDNADHLYFNDCVGNDGVRVYSTDGDYLGAAKSSGDNQMFPNEGFLVASKWNGDLLVNYASAVGRFHFSPKK